MKVTNANDIVKRSEATSCIISEQRYNTLTFCTLSSVQQYNGYRLVGSFICIYIYLLPTGHHNMHVLLCRNTVTIETEQTSLWYHAQSKVYWKHGSFIIIVIWCELFTHMYYIYTYIYGDTKGFHILMPCMCLYSEPPKTGSGQTWWSHRIPQSDKVLWQINWGLSWE